MLAKSLPDPALTEYTQVIIEQADRLRVLVDRLLGPQHPGTKTHQSIHHVVERVAQLISLECPENVILLKDYDPSLPELSHYPDQIEQVLLNITRNALQAVEKKEVRLFYVPVQLFRSHFMVNVIALLLVLM